MTPAEVGVEADVLAGLVEDVESRQVVAHTTAHDVVGDHRVEDRISRLYLVEHAGGFGVAAATVVIIVVSARSADEGEGGDGRKHPQDRSFHASPL